MASASKIKLTASEAGLLWSTYENDSMAKCMLHYFLETVEDKEIKAVVKTAAGISDSHVQRLAKIFRADGFPVPQGFTNEDVNLNAKRLYSDVFCLQYIKNMTKVGLSTYGMAYATSSRPDTRDFFHDCLREVAQLDQDLTETLLNKGILPRPPAISPADHIDFVNDQSFLSGGGLLGLGEKRPLLSLEIAHLFNNILANAVGKTLLLGFTQTAQSKQVKAYCERGANMASKHMEEFADILVKDNISTPASMDSEVTASAEPPFSDKMMLYHVSLLVAAGTANYAVSATASPRVDVALHYVKLAAEIAAYANDGAKLMIANGWLEEPPMAPDRRELSSV